MNKKSILILSSVSVVSFFLILSCTKDKGKLPVEVPPPPVEACDTITWTKHIKKIVETKCSTAPGCHTGAAPSGGVSLDTYAQVKNQADNGRIKARVIDGIPSFMPQGGQLPQNEKDLIACWLGNGKKE
jgi:uncharacterized membrane protein